MPDLPYGRLVSAPMISRAVETTLRAWLGQYIGEVLAQAGHDRDALPDPYDLIRSPSGEWGTENVPPLVVVVAPGTDGDPRRGTDAYTATWNVTVSVVVAMPTGIEVLDAAQFYAAALYCLQHKGIDLAGASIDWQGEDVTPVRRPGDERTLLAGRAEFNVTVLDARSLYGGPETPPDIDPETGERPREPAPGAPTVDETFVHIRKDPIA